MNTIARKILSMTLAVSMTLMPFPEAIASETAPVVPETSVLEASSGTAQNSPQTEPQTKAAPETAAPAPETKAAETKEPETVAPAPETKTPETSVPAQETKAAPETAAPAPETKAASETTAPTEETRTTETSASAIETKASETVAPTEKTSETNTAVPETTPASETAPQTNAASETSQTSETAVPASETAADPNTAGTEDADPDDAATETAEKQTEETESELPANLLVADNQRQIDQQKAAGQEPSPYLSVRIKAGKDFKKGTTVKVSAIDKTQGQDKAVTDYLASKGYQMDESALRYKIAIILPSGSELKSERQMSVTVCMKDTGLIAGKKLYLKDSENQVSAVDYSLGRAEDARKQQSPSVTCTTKKVGEFTFAQIAEIKSEPESETDSETETKPETESESEAEPETAGQLTPKESDAETESELLTEAYDEAETESEFLTEVFDETETETEEFSLFAENNGTVSEAELDKIDFSSKRLIVGTDNNSIFPDEVNIVSSYEGLNLLQFDTVKETRNAYSYFYDKADFVEADTEIHAAEGSGQASSDAGSPVAIKQADAALSGNGGYDIALIDTGSCGLDAGAVSVLGGSPADDNGHGTAMAGYIKEEAPNARILSIKALDASGSGDISAVVFAIKLAIENGVRIINLSISARATADNAALEEMVGEAVGAGITVVGAAGNNGRNARWYVPAKIGSAVIVGACDESGNRISSSNYGDTVDYYVVAGSTSEAAARMSAFIYAGNVQNSKVFSSQGTPLVPQDETEDQKPDSTDDKGRFQVCTPLHFWPANFLDSNEGIYNDGVKVDFPQLETAFNTPSWCSIPYYGVRPGYTFIGWNDVDSTQVYHAENYGAHATEGKYWNNDKWQYDNPYPVFLYATYVKNPVINDAITVQDRDDAYYVYIDAAAGDLPIYFVRVATWTDNNGQDDLIWRDATNGNYTINGHSYNYRLYVSTSEHNNEHGKYYSHVYVTDTQFTDYDHGHNTGKPTEFQFSYTAQFNGNGGTNGNSITKHYDEQLGTLPTSTKDGHYSFDGWYTAPTGGKKISSSTHMPLYGATYYAHWTKQYTCDVNTIVNGHEVTNKKVATFSVKVDGKAWVENEDDFYYWVAHGSQVEVYDIKENTADHYKYKGLNPNYTWTNIYTEDRLKFSMPEKNVAIALSFEQKFTVTFNANGGKFGNNNSTQTQDGFTGNALGTLPTPTRTGYTFAGWWTAASGGTRIYNTTKMPERAVTYYAHWTPNIYKVTLNNQSATTAGTTAYWFIYKTHKNINGTEVYGWSNAACTSPLSGGQYITVPKRTGYTFGGYYTGTNGTGEQYINDNGDMVNSIWDGAYAQNVTLYAKWTINQYTVTRRYRLQNADGSYQNYQKIDSNKYNYNSTIRAWSRPQDDTYNAASIPAHTVQARNETLSVDVTRRTAYNTIQYRLQNPDSSYGNYQNGWSGTLRVGEGHTWSRPHDATYQGASMTITGTAFSQTAQVDVKRRTYTASFNGNEGSDGREISKLAGNALGTLPASERRGYKFVGWFTEKNGGTQIDETTPISNTTYYAHWNIIKYQITYEMNGGTLDGWPESYDVTRGFSLQVPHKDGWTFTGWSGTGLNGSANMTVTVAQGSTGNRNYEAHWEKKITLTQKHGGDASSTQYYTLHDSDTGHTFILGESTKNYEGDDWHFAGWTTSKTPRAPEYTTEITIADDTTIYATFSQTETATFYYYIGNGTQARTQRVVGTAYSYGGADGIENQYPTIDAPAEGQYKGWTGRGYATWPAKADGEIMVESSGKIERLSEDKIYYGLYQRTNKISYDPNEGDPTPDTINTIVYVSSLNKEALVGTTQKLADAISRTGYTFAGWKSSLDNKTYAAEAPYAPTADVTMTAQWTANTYNVVFDPNGAEGSEYREEFTYDQSKELTANSFRRTYKVTFDGNNGTTPDPNYLDSEWKFTGWKTEADGTGNSYTDGQSVSNLAPSGEVRLYAQWNKPAITLPETSRDGYTFAGWQSSPGGETYRAGESYTPTDNVTMTANWTVNAYTIAYDLNGTSWGDQTPKTSYTIEDGDYTLPTPARAGYTFMGWTGSNVDVRQTEVTIAHGSIGDKNYTANWEVTATVTPLEADYTGAAQNLIQSVAIPEDARIEYSTDTGESKTYSETVPTGTDAGSYTVYYQVTADNNDADPITGSVTAVINKIAPIITLTDASGKALGDSGSTVFPAVYTFNAAVTGGGQGGGELSVESSDTSVVNASIDDNGMVTLTPVSASTETVTITVSSTKSTNYNAGSKTYSFTVNAGTIVVSTKDTTADYDGNGHPAGTLTVTAPAAGYTVEYSSDNEQTWSQTMPEYTNAGDYTTKYKVTAANYNTVEGTISTRIKKVAQGEPTVPTDVLTYNGQEQSLGDVTPGNGAKAITDDPEAVTYSLSQDGQYTATAPTKTDAGTYPVYYKIKGDGNHNDYEGQYSRTINKKRATLTLSQTASTVRHPDGQTFTYSYDGNGEVTVATSDESVATATVDTTTKTVTITTKNVNGRTATITVTAAEGSNYLGTFAEYQITVNNIYTVQYDANGGDGSMEQQTIAYGSEFTTRQNAFTKTGYTFNGWHEKADGSGDDAGWTLTSAGVYESGQGSRTWDLNRDITLYAQWTANTYTVQFDSNSGGKASGKMQDVTYTYDDAKAELPEQGYTWQGYTFQGWNTEKDGSGKVSRTDKGLVNNLVSDPNGEITLYAIWSENPFTVTIPTTIRYSNMPVGKVDTTDSFDIKVEGDYPGTVSVKAGADDDMTGDAGSIHAHAASSSTKDGITFRAAKADPETQAEIHQDMITMKGEVKATGTYTGSIQYIVGHDADAVDAAKTGTDG